MLALGITEMVTKDGSLECLEAAVTRALMAPDPGKKRCCRWGRAKWTAKTVDDPASSV